MRLHRPVEESPIMKILKYKFKFTPSKTVLLLGLFWLGSRILLNQIFSFHIGLDTDDYLKVANAIISFDFSKLVILKPIGYPLFLAMVQLTPLSIGFMQAMLSFVTAFQIYFLVHELTRNRNFSTFSFLLYSVYPLTYFFERQGMSETFASLLLVSGLRLVISMANNSSANKKWALGLVVFTLHLTRPNLSIFFLVFFLIGIFVSSNLTLKRSRYIILTAIVLAQLVTSSLELSFPTSPKYAVQGISEGIVEHMLDTLPASKTHQDLASSIITSEMEVRASNPGTRIWAIPHGVILFQETSGESRASAYRELLALGISSAIEYPGIYISSINASFFSIFSGNPNTYLPGAESASKLLRGATLIICLVIQNLIFILGGFLPFLMLVFVRRRGNFLSNTLIFPISIGFLACLLLNAIIYPVDELRYIFPLIPILIVNGLSLIHYSNSFSLIQQSHNDPR